MTSLEDDLRYLRDVADDDRPSIVRAGAIMLAAGGVFGLSAFRSWAFARGFIASPWAGLPPIDAILLFLIALAWIQRRIPGSPATTAATRGLTAAMTSIGISVTILALVLTLAGSALGSPDLIQAFPAIMFIIFATGWWVTLATVRRAWLAAFVGGGFAFALLCAALAGQPEVWLALAAGLLVTVVTPGWMLIRSERAG